MRKCEEWFVTFSKLSSSSWSPCVSSAFCGVLTRWHHQTGLLIKGYLYTDFPHQLQYLPQDATYRKANAWEKEKTAHRAQSNTHGHYWRSWGLLSFLFLSWVLKNNNLHLILTTRTWRQHDTSSKEVKTRTWGRLRSWHWDVCEE